MVVFNATDAASGNYYKLCSTTINYVTIYSKVNNAITIPSIVVYRNSLVASGVAITTTLTNCTGASNNPAFIYYNGIAKLSFTANDGYMLPRFIDVTGYGSMTWDDEQGIVTIGSPITTNPVTITINAQVPAFLISSTGPFTLSTANSAKNWDGTLESSTDGATWATWNGGPILASTNRLYLRGTNNTYLSDNTLNSRFVISGSNITLSQPLEHLLDYQKVINHEHPTMASDCFASLFRNNANIVSLEKDLFTFETLATRCFADMFAGCTGLTTVDESLLAGSGITTLAPYCFGNMFGGCTNLTGSCMLPWTDLTGANYCYQNMYQNCTSMTGSSGIFAETLSDGCCNNMFLNCVNLISCEQLYATQLKPYCYQNMYKGCTGIKLSETETGTYSIPYRIPSMNVGEGTISTAHDMENMFEGTGGTFTGTPTINTTYYRA